MGVSISLSGLLSLDLDGNGDRGLEDLAAHVGVSGGSLPTLSCHAMSLSVPVCLFHPVVPFPLFLSVSDPPTNVN